MPLREFMMGKRALTASGKAVKRMGEATGEEGLLVDGEVMFGGGEKRGKGKCMVYVMRWFWGAT